MSPVSFYSAQLRVLWEWRGGPRSLAKRLLITLVVSGISLWVTAWILPGLHIDRFIDGLVAVILMALFNALVRPLVLAFVAPRSLILTGISVIVLQVLVFLAAANLAPGVRVDGLLSALLGSFLYAGVNTALTAILGIDRGDSFYGLLIQSLMTKRAAPKSDQPGLVNVQIDGLAHPILAGRIRAGSVNTMAGWMRSGSHKLSRWEAILP
ncbi:MAG TPA: phage holin family protein, partial [Myxococcaceae bacterium]|nr:phage holin family protein [Myxococcaceae bacterium]